MKVRVTVLKEAKGKTKALATIEINDLVINGARVIEGSKGLFVSMPSVKDKEGNYNDVVYPKTADLRKEIQTAVIEEYEKAVK